MSKFVILMAASVAAVTPAMAQSSSMPYSVQETGGRYATLQQAVRAIGDAKATIVIAPGTYRECVVQDAGDISYRAASNGTAIFDGTTCEGKAGFVLRGKNATIDGIVFQNMKVPDKNGAGIRLERGNLSIANSLFQNSENGILTGGDPTGAIKIDRSTFRKVGLCEADCAHGIYVGPYGSLTVTRSRFDQGTGGHYLKSRAKQVTITDNSFDDSNGHVTNYMIDLSNGSSGVIRGNDMVQGRDKDNYSAFIAVAPEGRENDSSNLTIDGNSASFVPGLKRNSTFVANWSGDAVKIGQNKLSDGIKVTDRR